MCNNYVLLLLAIICGGGGEGKLGVWGRSFPPPAPPVDRTIDTGGGGLEMCHHDPRPGATDTAGTAMAVPHFRQVVVLTSAHVKKEVAALQLSAANSFNAHLLHPSR